MKWDHYFAYNYILIIPFPMKATNVYLNVRKQRDAENGVKFSQTIQILGAAIDSSQTIYYVWIDKNDIQSEDNKTHISIYNVNTK